MTALRRATRLLGVLMVALSLAACWPDPPRASHPTTPQHITVRFVDKSVFWNGVKVDVATQDRLLEEIAHRTPQPAVYLVPGRVANYATVARFLASAQRAGVVHLGFTGIETTDP